MEDSWTLATILIKLGLYATSFITAGTALFLITVGPVRPAIDRSTRHFGGLSALMAFAFCVLYISVQAGFLADDGVAGMVDGCLLYTSPSPRDGLLSRMPSSA